MTPTEDSPLFGNLTQFHKGSLEITVMVTCGSAVMALQLQIPRFFAKEAREGIA